MASRKNLIRAAASVLGLALAAFAVWTVLLVQDVRGLRAEVEANVSELTQLSAELASTQVADRTSEILEQSQALRADNSRISRELGARWSGLESALLVSLALIAVNIGLLLFAPSAASAAHRLEVMGQAAQALGVGVALLRDGHIDQVDPSLRSLVSSWPSVEAWWSSLPGGQGRLDLLDPLAKRRVMELRVIPSPEGGLAILLVEDITDLTEAREARVALRERLANADRLATAGLLAAGLGHEIKNPLTLVRSNLELLDLDLELEREVNPVTLRRLVERGLRGVDRVDAVVSGIRRMSLSDVAPVPTDLHALLASTLDLASVGLRGVALDQQLEPVPLVRGDPGRLGQVVLNLLANAGHALEGRPDPQVVVRLYATPGEVCVEVQDNGPGVPEPLRGSLFEPLVTGRPSRGGTGLGLAISRQIVEEMHGRIELLPAPEGGALFRVSLPWWSEERSKTG